MPWYAWAMIALVALSSLLTVANVGAPRKPLEGGTAALAVLVNALFILGIVALAHG